MHSVLKAAHDAVAPTVRPPPPHHGGVDANPQLGSFGFGGVSLFLAEAAEPVVKKAERPRYTQWLGRARDVYERHATAQGTMVKRGTKTQRRVLTKQALAELRRDLTVQGVVRARDDLPLALAAANVALLASYDVELQVGGGETVGAIRRTAAAVAAALPLDRARPFLEALDQRMLREELRAMLVKRGDPRAAEVESCLWRAAFGRARQGRAAGAQVSHLMGRCRDGTFLLHWKSGTRWEVCLGDRDSVLATLPEALMPSALQAVMT